MTYFSKITIIRQTSTYHSFYNKQGDCMKEVIVNIVLLIFPILMYLVFTCYNSLTNKKIIKIIFIITMFTSLYLSTYFNLNNTKLLILCNIPILICYYKKEHLLAIILSVITILCSYFKYDTNIVITITKYLSYLILYLITCKNKNFNSLFIKISAIIQGIFISFEYFLNSYKSIPEIIEVIIYIIIIYSLTFFCLYLFKLADKISSLYTMVNTVKEENKIKDSLFKLTHEIKNPIAVCKGYLDMINLKDTTKSSKYLSIIKSEIDRSLNVIADFMEYSKIKINKEIFDLVMLLDDITDSFSILINNKNIKLTYDNPYEEIYLNGDYERLKQVFVNIIKNSFESITDSGIINIDLFCHEKDVIITISDNGIGMTEEELSNMKEMFYTTKKNGTGLGVALSNEIIEAHKGTMDYISKKNVGTKCIIKLPL